jgi:hypothetical protein
MPLAFLLPALDQPYAVVAQTRIPLSGSLKRFLFIKLGEAEDQRFELFESGGRVFARSASSQAVTRNHSARLPEPSLRFIKKRFRQSKKGFWEQPVDY